MPDGKGTEFEPSLFELSGDPDDRWVVLRTRSRQEKVIAADLAVRGMRFLLPLTHQVRYYGRRKAEIDAPLFPGYLFLRGSPEQAYAIDRSGRIASILPVADQAKLNDELRSLAIAFSNRVTLDPYPHLSVGRRVEVRAGPLRGIRGYVENRSSVHRLILQVEMLGRAVSMEIDSSLLDLV
jgi:transcriptional antiterminator NusG